MSDPSELDPPKLQKDFQAWSYESKEQFCGYWHQIDEILSSRPESVLYVGVGSGFVPNYLTSMGKAVVTADIDKALLPDKVCSVTDLPFAEGAFDVVACCEVLEHLPYDLFPRALASLHRVTRKRVVLSLPDIYTQYRLLIELPKIGRFRHIFPHPFPRKKAPSFHPNHQWEISQFHYPLEMVATAIESAGFRIAKTYRVFEQPYFRFFVLDK